MNESRTKGSIIVVFALVATVISACLTVRETTLPAPVRADLARVYFIFPTYPPPNFGADESYITLGTKLVGVISNRQAFKVDVPPGRHLFMGISSNTDAVEIDAAPGRTYFVQVSSARSQIPGVRPTTILTPLIPGFGKWDMRHKWLHAVQFVELKEGTGARWEERNLIRNERRIANIRSGKPGLKTMSADQGE